jgi:hypothetical protein
MNARPRSSLLRRVTAALGAPVLAAAALSAGGATTLGHSPNPLFGAATWDQDQVVGYRWWPDNVPPGWMATAIDLGAGDVGQSRGSRAATFTRQRDALSRIAYGAANPCPAYGIACVDRTGVPNKFAGMWFRPQGWSFDWGTLRWCQGLIVPANGCYDAENVALDEFGHIEILGHHVNFADERDFLDSVVQYAARSRPKDGWNEHVFGRCDIARLQLEYELPAPSAVVSTCLSLSTSLSIVPEFTWVARYEPVRITGNFKVAVATAARSLSGNPLSGRIITLQRRAPGASVWSNFGTLADDAIAGSYGLTITPQATYDYRLWFAATSVEGIKSSFSAIVRINVSLCEAISSPEGGGPSAPCA